MKTTFFIAAILTLTASAFLQAQETEATPRSPLGLRGAEPSVRSEPSVEVETDSTTYPKPGTPVVTPTPRATPTPSATPKAKATVTPKPIATARPTATPNPTATPKPTAKSRPSPTPRASASPTPRTKTTPTPTPAPSATATPRTASPAAALPKNAQAAVRELENRWATATAARDMTTIQGLLAGTYIGITSSGNIVNKAGMIAEIRRDKNTYEMVANSRVDVRIHGNTAVAVGTTKQKGKDAAGQDFSYTYRWTDTWVESNGEWQCVSSQSIRQSG